MLRILLGLGLLGMCLGGRPVFAEEAQYTLSRQYATVLFRVEYQNQATLVGHFDEFEGSLRLDPDNLAEARLDASVNMGSFSHRDGDLVEMLVYSSAWFNANNFPQAAFTTQEVEVLGPMEANFIGELSFMGITRPWTLRLQFKSATDDLSPRTLGIAASGSFLRSDFGLDQYMNVAADEVQIEVHARFNRN